jgi:multidrug efflux pump subunit AcrA (membrane-fusion protein)
LTNIFDLISLKEWEFFGNQSLGVAINKMIRHRLLSIIVALVAGLIYLNQLGCGERAETSEEKETQVVKVRFVKVSPVKISSPKGTIEYVGVLTAHRKVTIASEMSGTIEKLYFEKGDRVKKGQLLAEISTSSMRLKVQQAKAALAAAESNLEKIEKGSRPEEILIAEAVLKEAEAAQLEAEKNFRRVKDLQEFKAASNSEYDSAWRTLEMAKAKVESAKQQLHLARQGPRAEDRKSARANMEQAKATLALARDLLRKSRLLAPCDGTIAFRDVEEGEVIVVPPVTVITQIVDLDHLKVKLSLGEKDIHILESHKRFKFTVDAIPDRGFTCRLAFLSPVADPATRSFPVELTVEEPGKRMADGMTVRVKLPVVDKKATIKLPSAWLSEENGKIGFYTVKDGKAVFKQVTLGSYYDQRVEILSGLTEKDLIITTPSGLKSGDAVNY